MRVSAEHLEIMRAAIEPFDDELTRDTYRRGLFSRANLVKDLNKRYRWDLYWATVPNLRNNPGFDRSNYSDAHLDTALRKIVPAL